MNVLGIESSCDETSIAILQGTQLIANEIFSQKDHAAYGGVVPEIASRAHMLKIEPLCTAVLSQTNLAIADIDLIAVTDRPGLAGALLVGISFALGLHTAYRIPITGVNHLDGHIASVFLEHATCAYPFLALVVSGGHTALYVMESATARTLLGQTIDDAAGEAFDKIGKLIGFAYPAGSAIEKTAREADGKQPILFPVARLDNAPFNFSFSGLKTAVKNYCAKQGDGWVAANRPTICHSVQTAIVSALVSATARAMQHTGLHTLALVGGVACNGALRTALQMQFGEQNVFFPRPGLCTDNAAMIARAGYEMALTGRTRFPAMQPTAAL